MFTLFGAGGQKGMLERKEIIKQSVINHTD
jgi:hypothetical protein